MPIQIDPVNLGGLAQLAGRQQNLSYLPVPGELGLKSLQLTQAKQIADQQAAIEMARIRAQDEAALRSRGLAREQMAQQNQQYQQGLAQQATQGLLTANQNQQQLGAAQQQALLDQSNKDRTFGLAVKSQADTALNNQQTQALNYLKQNTAALATKKKEDLNEMGSFATTARMAMDKTPDPSAAKALQTQLVSAAADKGYIPKDAVSAISQMPISSFKTFLDSAIVQTGHVQDYQGLNKVQAAPTGATTSVYDPNTGKLVYTSKLTTPNESKAQENLMDAKDGLAQLAQYKDPPENFFGLGTLGIEGNRLREQFKIIPGVAPSPEQQAELGKYADYNANANLMIMKTAKAMAGSRFSDTDLATIKLIMPSVGFGQTKPEYDAKYKMMERYLTQLADSRKKLISKGLEVGTEAYDQAMSTEMQQKYVEMAKPGAMEYYHKKYPTWTDDQIRQGIINNEAKKQQLQQQGAQ